MIRETRPGAGDKYFIRKASGGFSSCIKGNPTDSQCDVLSNCVGYANGAFNETCENGYEKYNLSCNAENFIERAVSLGLQISKEPSVGGIIVWAKGQIANGNDGAGHVEHIVRYIDANTIETRASNYAGTAFYKAIRKRGDGNWGLKSPYWYRGSIINPKIGYKPFEPTPVPPTPTPTLKFNIGDKVVLNGVLYGKSNGENPGKSVKNKVTIITRAVAGAKCPYNTTGDLGWVEEASVALYVEPTPPTPPVTGLKVGDKVEIIARGNANSAGTGIGAYGIGYKRQILGIAAGAANPYRVGNEYGTTGWYKETALRKVK